ncbi:MAG: AtpZ/AtpI family protein [Pyrinomonadaceae bacterium]
MIKSLFEDTEKSDPVSKEKKSTVMSVFDLEDESPKPVVVEGDSQDDGSPADASDSLISETAEDGAENGSDVVANTEENDGIATREREQSDSDISEHLNAEAIAREADTVSTQKDADPFTVPDSPAEIIRKTGLAYSAAIAMFGSVIFMMILGWFGDLMLGTSPWGIVLGIFVGAGIGFFQLFQISSRIIGDKPNDFEKVSIRGPVEPGEKSENDEAKEVSTIQSPIVPGSEKGADAQPEPDIVGISEIFEEIESPSTYGTKELFLLPPSATEEDPEK